MVVQQENQGHGAIQVGHVAGNVSITHAMQGAAPQSYELKARERLPVRCHADLDIVIRHSGCSMREIHHAIRTAALGDVGGSLVRRYRMLDLVAGRVLLGMVFLLQAFIAWVTWDRELSCTAQLEVIACLIGTMVLSAVTVHEFLAPQRTAKRAMEALEGHRRQQAR